jgi:hypothetical protein
MDESSLITEPKVSKHFVLQLDESTDVCKNSVLVAFVCYGHEKVRKTELLLCKNISTTTTGKDVFDIISSFLMNIICSGHKFVLSLLTAHHQ